MENYSCLAWKSVKKNVESYSRFWRFARMRKFKKKKVRLSTCLFVILQSIHAHGDLREWFIYMEYYLIKSKKKKIKFSFLNISQNYVNGKFWAAKERGLLSSFPTFQCNFQHVGAVLFRKWITAWESARACAHACVRVTRVFPARERDGGTPPRAPPDIHSLINRVNRSPDAVRSGNVVTRQRVAELIAREPELSE